MAPAVATYTPRDPSHTVLYTVIAEHLETLLASLDADPDATGLPAYVEREFYDYLGLHKDSCKSGHSIRAGFAGGLFLLFRTDELHRLFQILE